MAFLFLISSRLIISVETVAVVAVASAKVISTEIINRLEIRNKNAMLIAWHFRFNPSYIDYSLRSELTGFLIAALID